MRTRLIISLIIAALVVPSSSWAIGTCQVVELPRDQPITAARLNQAIQTVEDCVNNAAGVASRLIGSGSVSDAVDLGTAEVSGIASDAEVSNTLTFSCLSGSGSTTCAADANTAEFPTLTDAMLTNTLTGSILIGSGSTTNAVDLATAEVAGTLPTGNLPEAVVGAKAAEAPKFLQTPVNVRYQNATTSDAACGFGVVAQYLGKAAAAYTSCSVRYRVQAATGASEFGFLTGTATAVSPVSLTKRSAGVAMDLGTTGPKTTVVAVSGITAGDDLWVAWPSNGSVSLQGVSTATGMCTKQTGLGGFAAAPSSIATLATPQDFVTTSGAQCACFLFVVQCT